MKKTIKIALIAALVVLTGCQSEEPQRISRLPKELKEVEIFQIGLDQPKLNFTITGTAESANSTYLSSEIPGRITDMTAQIGQNVKKGETLITLGDSLNTDILDSNYQFAQNSQNLAETSLYLTEQNSFKTAEATKLQANTAFENYKNTIKNLDVSEELFDNQYDISTLDLDSLEKAYKASKEAYEDAQDNLDDAEEAYDDYSDSSVENPALEEQLKANIKIAKAQVDSSKLAMQTNKNRVEQSEIGLQNLEENYNSQKQDLIFAGQAAYNQFIATVNQSESAEIGSNLQELQSQAQLLQANNSLNSVIANKTSKTIKAPIEGKITEITAQKGNLVNPGQLLVKIENNKILKIKTSVNYEELKFIRPNMAVTIEMSGQNLQGLVNSINTVADEISKKFEIEIIANNSNEIPLEGFAKVYFVPQIFSGIYIPINSINISDATAYVYVLDPENKVRTLNISLGVIVGNYIEVKSGLNPKDRIVLPSTQILEIEEIVKIKPKPVKRKP